MTYPGSAERRLRVVALADADSFVKWSASLLDAVPDISRHLVLVRTPLTVSEAQERDAIAGTAFGRRNVTRLGFEQVASWLGADRPDVVVLAGRAPFVRLMLREIDRLSHRPVTVSGLPGISIPAQRGALEHRARTDLVVLHSRRELRAFGELAERIGASVPFALATLPFARVKRSAASAPDAAERTGSARQKAARPAGATGMPLATGGTDLVFAAQALVPASRADRLRIADMLRRAALADPSRRVVVKLRSRPGEVETHEERVSYRELLEDPPANLVFSHEPMADALATAEGLVTVSSTAAIEALAAGVPVIALDTFGVRSDLLNPVFADSGLLGGEYDVVTRRFRHPDPAWAEDDYFHDPAESTWWERVQELVAQRRRGVLPARTVPRPRGGALHLAWHRKSVLGHEDRTLSGTVAFAIGAPAARALLAVRRLREGSRDAGADVTTAPTTHRDPIRRRSAARASSPVVRAPELIDT